MSRGPVVRITPAGGNQGIRCCCCTCCTCVDFGYIRSRHGLTKIAEMLLGALCQSLLIEYGLSEASTMGSAFHGFLTTTSSCVLTTTILLFCYIFSVKSQNLIRQSIFECVFNATACFLYLSAASCLAAAVTIYLYPQYVLLRMYSAYPAMTAVYYIGAVLGTIHGIDAYLAYRYYKGYR